jgi:hypothetical protein
LFEELEKTSGSFREFPGVSGSFREFPGVSGSFREFPGSTDYCFPYLSSITDFTASILVVTQYLSGLKMVSVNSLTKRSLSGVDLGLPKSPLNQFLKY